MTLGRLLTLIPAFFVITGCSDASVQAQSQDVTAAVYGIWVTDRGSDTVVAFDQRGEFQRVVVPSGIVDAPSSVRLGPEGWLYVTGFGDNEITRVDQDGRMVDEFFGDAGLLEEPVDLSYRDGRWYVLGNDTRNLIVIADEGPTVSELAHPVSKDAHAFAFGPDGAIYIAASAQPSHGAIEVRDAETGDRLRDFGREISNATSLAFSQRGELWVADYAANQLVRFDAQTGVVTEVLSPPGLSRPVSLAVAPDGWLYVADDAGVSRVHVGPRAELELVVRAGVPSLERARNIAIIP